MIVVLIAILAMGSKTHRVAAPRCQSVKVVVTLPDDADRSIHYRIAGQLCAVGSPAGKPLQLLVHGMTYTHTYWAWPYQPQRYSYVNAATAAGYATLAIDRLGVGASSAPSAGALAVPAQASALSQIVRALRAGAVAQTRFGTIIGVGHSGGAAIWAYQAATEPSPDARADALILAGYLHTTNPAQINAIDTALWPATDDPAFAGRRMPDGYLTTKPGSRLRLFHNPRFVDARVVDLDEKSKGTSTADERASIAEARQPGLTEKISVPVLVAVGQQDRLFCDPAKQALSCANPTVVLNRESSFYSPAAHLDVHVLAKAGHATNLAPNATDWYKAANDWADQWISRR